MFFYSQGQLQEYNWGREMELTGFGVCQASSKIKQEKGDDHLYSSEILKRDCDVNWKRQK